MPPPSPAHWSLVHAPGFGKLSRSCNLAKWPLDVSPSPHLLALPSQAGSDCAPSCPAAALLPSSQSCPWRSKEREGKPVSTAAYQQEKTLTTCIILALMATWFLMDLVWRNNATAAKIRIRGFHYNGWYHPKHVKQQQFCSLFSVGYLWCCLQCTKCLWSGAEEEMQSPDTHSCLIRKWPAQLAMCWVPSVFLCH